ncbi:hypothetical protein F0562_010438 [Nyssa sinensis]|uniref:Retrovirus-related Pol polyprotein from transposon TNT 1-94-like beta-barrel domain-containing protein n=1 Tax=Nyssa sinensis TaxID=561372 RepID=A0A5J5A3V9_9ASTE|nr:hypothetical protein F0562_010438 [Nyssa sinensis]
MIVVTNNNTNTKTINFKEEEEEEDEEDTTRLLTDQDEETKKNLWYLDTGYNNHMYGDKSTFSYLDESFHDNVKFGDNSRVSVMGK